MRFLGRAMSGCVLAGVVVIASGGLRQQQQEQQQRQREQRRRTRSTSTRACRSRAPSTAQTDPGSSTAMKLALVAGAATRPASSTSTTSRSTTRRRSADNWDLNADARPTPARRPPTPKAVYYIGEFNSGASEVSIPILNQAGIPQVSPANTYVGLTTNEPGSAPGEPQKYYPTGKRTYLRIVPRDTIQAAAGLADDEAGRLHEGRRRQRQDAYGAGLADAARAGEGQVRVDGHRQHGLDPDLAELPRLRLDDQGPGCGLLLLRGIVSTGEVQMIKDVNAALPNAKIFGGDGICSGGVHQPGEGRLPGEHRAADPVHGRDPGPHRAIRAAGQFLAAYKAKYGASSPDPYAIYGYEAMKLGLDTIAELGPKGNDKAAVLAALFAIKARHSVLGTYGFDSNGDTTLKSYGLYKVGTGRQPAVRQDGHAESDVAMLAERGRRGGPAPPLRLTQAVEANSLATRLALAGRQDVGAGAVRRVRWPLGFDRRAAALPDLLRDPRPRLRLPGVRRTATRPSRHDLTYLGEQPRPGDLQRRDLGADRDRLHAGLRDHRADQLRPRRRVHDRLVHRRRLLGVDRTGPGHRPARAWCSACC